MSEPFLQFVDCKENLQRFFVVAKFANLEHELLEWSTTLLSKELNAKISVLC